MHPSCHSDVTRDFFFQFLWLTGVTVGLRSVDETKVMSKHLPKFLFIVKEHEGEVLRYVKKHVQKLSDGRSLVAKDDLAKCNDSAAWFRRNKRDIRKHKMYPLLYTPEIIKELNDQCEFRFGRSLLMAWLRGMILAEEELKHLRKIRKLKT